MRRRCKASERDEYPGLPPPYRTLSALHHRSSSGSRLPLHCGPLILHPSIQAWCHDNQRFLRAALLCGGLHEEDDRRRE